MAKNLTAYRGDSKILHVVVKTDAGVAIDITGWILFFTVKASKSDADVDAIIKKDITEHTHADAGLSDIVLTSTDTKVCSGNYFYDIQAKELDGTITTLIDGVFYFKEDVTIRTVV